MSATASTLLDRLSPVGGAEAAVAWLREHGLPTSKDEAWKYTDLKSVMATECAFVDQASAGRVDGTYSDQLLGDFGGPTLVFVDGFFSAELSRGLDGTPGLSLGHLDSSHIDRSLPTGRVDGFQMLNRATASNGVAVTVDDGVSVAEPIHIANVSTPAGQGVLTQPHVVVGVGSGSVLTIVETYVGSGGSGLVNAVTTIDVGPDATVAHYKVQNEVPSINHLSHLQVRQAKGSDFSSTSIMVGAQVARSSVDVIAAEDDTSTRLEGLYLPTGSQRLDNVATVEHAANRGSSSQVYKGVVDDHARGSFSGHIIVAADTSATDAHQSNRSLLLSPAAQSDSRPWLEIFADDVACTHGSAIGRLDPEALFYLQSRGIPLDEARSILIGGFMNEIVDNIDVDPLREYVAAVVSAKVSDKVSADIGGEH